MSSPASRFRLCWFTPTTEVDLCGHATLASAAVLFQHEGETHRENYAVSLFISHHTRLFQATWIPQSCLRPGAEIWQLASRAMATSWTSLQTRLHRRYVVSGRKPWHNKTRQLCSVCGRGGSLCKNNRLEIVIHDDRTFMFLTIILMFSNFKDPAEFKDLIKVSQTGFDRFIALKFLPKLPQNL